MKLGKLTLLTVVLGGLAVYVGAAPQAHSATYNVGMAFDKGLSAVVRYDDQFQFSAGNDGMAFDYLFLDGSFDADVPFTWYVGGGAWYEWDNDWGIRAPLGLNWNFAHEWHAYAQVSPEWQIQDKSKLQIGGAIGLTYRF
ncbi:hypothetical protein ST37_10645 [Vibrio sp. qd031]|uniref:hypothetical protein n=1 Tax=Vibrio TaxID=662 RepID=UPI000A0FBB6E|nr:MULTISPECIES: hypothetical protein [Vibrio]ORT50327.1 hypothetical protein ST37_10645 [Vibrio sp. qd031]